LENEDMKILTATAELTPIAQAGGLGDVAAFLPRELEKMGHNAIIVLPKYRAIDIEKWGFKNTHKTLVVQMGYWNEYALLWEGTLPNSTVKVYLVENNEYFDRAGIYGDPIEFSDNDRRFIFFSKAVFEVCKALGYSPDIIHAHDYHTAFTLAFLKEFYQNDPMFSHTAGVYTIHNLAYQGKFNPDTALLYSGIPLSKFQPYSPYEYYGMVNAMKVGIMMADKITTVSPTYSQEIRWSYFGEGLDGVINSRAADFIGILNGIDYDEWNPESDLHISAHYSIGEFDKKSYNKHKLLLDYGLSDYDDMNLPLISMVTRLTDQKGVDLVIAKLEELLSQHNFRFFLLGSGNYNYENYFRYLSHRFPKNALNYIGYNAALSHQVIAASDFFLMPSRFEPCGLTQMYSLRYGTIPIARQTGGIADSVFEYDYNNQSGNGFTFWQYHPDDMAYAISRALSIYNNQPHWNKIRENAMNHNLSATTTATKYLEVYQWAINSQSNA
jgi:starch synthase